MFVSACISPKHSRMICVSLLTHSPRRTMQTSCPMLGSMTGASDCSRSLEVVQFACSDIFTACCPRIGLRGCYGHIMNRTASFVLYGSEVCSVSCNPPCLVIMGSNFWFLQIMGDYLIIRKVFCMLKLMPALCDPIFCSDFSKKSYKLYCTTTKALKFYFILFFTKISILPL